MSAAGHIITRRYLGIKGVSMGTVDWDGARKEYIVLLAKYWRGLGVEGWCIRELLRENRVNIWRVTRSRV